MAFLYKVLNNVSAKSKAADVEMSKLQTQVNSVLSRDECQQTKPLVLVNRCQQTLPVSVQGEPADSLLLSEVNRLKRMVADLIYENNRYHLALSNCHCSTLDDAISDVPAESLESIRASTPLSCHLPSSAPEVKSNSVPALVSGSTEDSSQFEVDKKDEAFVRRMLKTLTKLESKYLTPVHKRKKRLFTRKKRKIDIVPKEFSSIYEHLASPGPLEAPPMLIPQVNWHNVKFKPVLPSPEECAVHSCSEDPDFYKEKIDCFKIRYNLFHKKNPFGSLLGYRTTLGTVPVPTEPIGGYVFCTETRKWVLYATPPAANRGLIGGVRGFPHFRKKG